jgi:tRNA dimethylallyltransferase
MPESPLLVALFGATALGKTEVAVALAERLKADIVVADSMQAYRGLAIVTNQPSERLCARARHHLVGFVAPQDELTVAGYAQAAHRVIDDLLAAGRPVIVEGGSGLYLRAALGDLEFAARPNPALRRELEERWSRDPSGVVDELRSLDPHTLARLDTANGRRVIRALEVVHVSGRPLPVASRNRLWRPAERYAHRLFALVPDQDRTALTARIEARVDEMLAAGALEEVAQARAAGPFSRTVLQAIGLRELCACLDGDATLADAAARMKARTRALARRQLTWLRKLPATAQVPAAGRPPAAVAEAILSLLRVHAW